MIRLKWALRTALYASILYFLIPLFACANDVRKPVWDGQFYPGDKAGLLKMLASLSKSAAEQNPKDSTSIGTDMKIKALILPHAGYIYSGFTAAHAGMVLKNRTFKKVIVMGPDHRVGFQNGAISDVSYYETPLGKIPVHSDAKMLLKEHEIFRSVPESDRSEHSIEVILPFLQYFLHDFECVPIVLGYGDPVQYADVIKSKLDDNTLLVASSDLSHFLSYETAVQRDAETIRLILENNKDQLKKRDNAACGKIPVMVLQTIAVEKGWTPVLINYTNSGDTAGDKKRVVGYSTIAYY